MKLQTTKFEGTAKLFNERTVDVISESRRHSIEDAIKSCFFNHTDMWSRETQITLKDFKN